MIYELVEFISACIIVSACLAVYLDDVMYSLISLMIMFISTAVLYSLSGALYAAIFQLVVGAGALTAFFLLSEELTEHAKIKYDWRRMLLTLLVSLFLAAVPILYPAENNASFFSCEEPFTSALWSLRVIDIVLQGVAILTVALGVSVILYEERREGKKK